jgi:hypothetical protein
MFGGWITEYEALPFYPSTKHDLDVHLFFNGPGERTFL